MMMMKVTITAALVAVLLFGLAGSAMAQEETDSGNLLFHHDAKGYGSLEVALYDGGGEQPVGLGKQPIGLFALGYGETFDLGLYPEGEYELTVTTSVDPDTVIAALGDLHLRTDAVTTVTAVAGDQGELGFVVDAKHAVAPPSPSPKAVRTPTRVETGGGGTAPDGNDALLAGVALAAGLLAAAAHTRASAA